MSRRVSPRHLPERMDAPECDPERLREALRVVAAVNGWTGGRRAVLCRALDLLPSGRGGVLRVLDVGCGWADVPEALGRRLRARGRQIRIVLSDVHGSTLRIARERLRDTATPPGLSFEFVRLDGASLPFRDGSFDLVLCSTTLHHLETAGAVRLLREMHRLSRHGWVVTDLRRSPLAYAAARLLARTAWRRRPLPRADGPVSVLRAFTASEARRLVARAGLSRVARVDGGPLRIAILGRPAGA